jgi:glc operon protein GlcG
MALTRTRKVVDTPGADAVIAVAEAAAVERGSRVYICVVDPSGEVVAMRRTRGAQVAGARVAVDKARTAAIFVRPSRELEEQVTGARLGALALHGASALVGAIPLKVGDEVVGAIGASGETPDEDERISIAGAASRARRAAARRHARRRGRRGRRRRGRERRLVGRRGPGARGDRRHRPRDGGAVRRHRSLRCRPTHWLRPLPTRPRARPAPRS